MTKLTDDLRAAPLGHLTEYPDTYDPALLFTVPRADTREWIGIDGALPFDGVDVWTAYEHTWLDTKGKPQVAMLALEVPAASRNIVESKSMKLYLGSFAQSRFAGAGEVIAAIERDLTRATLAAVRVTLTPHSQFGGVRIAQLSGESIDDLDLAIDRYEVDASVLQAHGATVEETLRSDLFRSLCPVTAQPDYASVSIAYRGPRIDRPSLLRYLVSYRKHAGFHEHCVERMFVDLRARCGCDALTVNARFTRRGGLDINPFRSNAGASLPANVRTPRQ